MGKSGTLVMDGLGRPLHARLPPVLRRAGVRVASWHAAGRR
jgi:hypothetical protein